MKITTRASSILLLLAALGASVSAFSHHSFAVYDLTKMVTMKGEVKSFQWTNPHSVIWLTVKPEGGGASEDWAFETTSPGVLTRSGWTRNSVKAGDKVTVEFHPLRDGSHGGGLKSVTLPDGTKLSASFTAPGEKEKP